MFLASDQTVRLSTDRPALSVLTRQGLPRCRSCVTAGQRQRRSCSLRCALHVDPSYAVTKSAMIEEGTSSPWTWHFARTYRTPPSGRGKYGLGSLNRPTFMAPQKTLNALAELLALKGGSPALPPCRPLVGPARTEGHSSG